MIAIILFLLLFVSAELLAQTPYYQGKTITFIVGSGAGTAYDMYARLLANHISKHIPGIRRSSCKTCRLQVGWWRQISSTVWLNPTA